MANESEMTPVDVPRLPKKVEADAALEFALDAMELILSVAAEQGLDVSVRVGVATGLVASGVLGSRQVSFDVWGDPVTRATALAPTSAVARVARSQECACRQAQRLLSKALAPVNAALEGKDYLIGDFSAADIMLGHACFMSNRIGSVSDDMTNLKAYVTRISERPAFQKAITMS